ncbi:tRNA pseudouridine(55) synthase TruB [Nesterenkonia flava]|uniref:tRNA pseudouridine synthase B n=1 Tax=Nesterenkonia flava TaxID=469799 RepID=A0ABU1FR51_9MICC|nr:tRNA pseudouridine(55) synthase TruB [Nesterenkonia flava]MDR5711130.1 tRNA pseudouridine(55) synthase TruB [Nesterenkonia flava]
MGKKQKPEELEVGSGLVLVDKPAGWTSHDVVGRIRKLAGTRKVGHAGTLDPMATGVLVVGINRATRLLTHIVGVGKTYTATVRLGQSTTTDDAEGEVLATRFANAVTEERIAAAVAELTGEIQQVPSTVSAVKVDGRRAYDRARSGENVELHARPVTVHRFDVLEIRRVDDGKIVDLDIEVRVSSGTYVRALARDLGEALDTAGHLTALRRTAVGPYSIDQTMTLEQLGGVNEDGDFGYIGLAEAAAQLFPARRVSAEEAEHLRHGRRITASAGAEVIQPSTFEPVAATTPSPAEVTPRREGLTAAFGPDGELIALLRDIPAKPGASSSPDAAKAAVAGPAALQAKPELVFAAD